MSPKDGKVQVEVALLVESLLFCYCQFGCFLYQCVTPASLVPISEEMVTEGVSPK